MTEPVSRATERTLPELVGWVKQEGLALNLANDRLAFLIAIATLSRDDSSHELTEAALHDAFGYVSQIFGAFNRQLSTGSQQSKERIEPEISFAYNPGLISSWFFVPGVIALVLNLVSTLVSSAAVVREKDSGTLEQLLMTPVNSFQILLAKIIPLSILLMGTVTFSLLIALLVFHVPFRGNILLFFFCSFLSVLVCISLGIVLAAFSENQ